MRIAKLNLRFGFFRLGPVQFLPVTIFRRTVRPSDSQTLRLSDPQTLRLSDPQTLRLSDPQTLRTIA